MVSVLDPWLWSQLFLASAGFGLGVAVIVVAFGCAERGQFRMVVRNALASHALVHLAVLGLRGAPPGTEADLLPIRALLVLVGLALLGYVWSGRPIPAGLLPVSGRYARGILAAAALLLVVAAGPVGLLFYALLAGGGGSRTPWIPFAVGAACLLLYCLPIWCVGMEGWPLRWRRAPAATSDPVGAAPR